MQAITPEKVNLWAERAWKDHLRKAPVDAPVKQKVGVHLNLIIDSFVIGSLVRKTSSSESSQP